MKKVLMSTVAAAMAMSFVVSADAASKQQRVSDSVQASCKAQAAKKFSAIHFLKRRNFANNCMAQHANAKPKAAPVHAAKAKDNAQPMAAAPAVKPSTTGQAPKQ
jgi:hypothetical protein